MLFRIVTEGARDENRERPHGLVPLGNKATGNMVVTGTPTNLSRAVTIMLSGNDVYLVYPTGFTGYLTVSGDEMKGQIDGMNPANVVLKRQK